MSGAEIDNKLYFNTQSGLIEQIKDENAIIKNIRASATTIRSSRESAGLIPVQEALAMIN